MSFRKELRVIPRTAWIVALSVLCGLATLVWFLIPTDHGIHGMARGRSPASLLSIF